MKKFILYAVAILTLLTISQAAFAADDKVGFVDDMAVLRQYPKFVEARKQIDESAKRKSDTAKAAFDKEKDQKKKAQIVQNMQLEMSDEEARIMNPILKEINDTIEKVAQQKGITIVLNKALIYYGGVDLTDDVVTALKR